MIDEHLQLHNLKQFAQVRHHLRHKKGYPGPFSLRNLVLENIQNISRAMAIEEVFLKGTVSGSLVAQSRTTNIYSIGVFYDLLKWHLNYWQGYQGVFVV